MNATKAKDMTIEAGMRKTGLTVAMATWLVLTLGGCAAQEAPATEAASAGAGNGTADGPAMAAASSCKDGESVAPYLGSYKTTSVERYRGGLTDETAAQARVGQDVVLSNKTFKVRDETIANPAYQITCHPVTRTEGEVPQEKWSTFYGFAPEREVVKVLEVQDPALGDEAPEFLLELVPGESGTGLWELYDGWIYRSSR